MHHIQFDDPVWIFVGLNVPRRVETVSEAYSVLAEWPQRQRDNAHRIALNACLAALGGTIDAETARGPFVAFARKSGILMPDLSDAEPGLAAGRSGALTAQLPA